VDFEWDPAKAARNLAKHSVDFEDAIEVFDDPDRVDLTDPHDRGEPRFQAIGAAGGIVLFVSYTLRDGSRRIISARRASRRERAAYTLQAGRRP
jgi:hypothetical protein